MASRTLHVRCSSWEQVEIFTTRKLRKGKLLSMKVPFAAKQSMPVTIGLELPNEVVVAIDGVEHLVRLLEQEGPQCLKRLLAIPRAPVGRAQAAHDLDERVEAFSGRGHPVTLPLSCVEHALRRTDRARHRSIDAEGAQHK